MDPRLVAFERLLNIMDDLREKCPWDKKQTLETLRPLTIEETYELTDAISDGDLKGVKEELGDLFLHLVFYSKIGTEKGAFTVDDVLNGVCDKLIHRHPHIYGEVQVADEEEVKRNWEKLKMKEGKQSLLEGVPKSLPGLVKATRVQEKVKQVGFEWEHKSQVWDKVEEEITELKEAEVNGDIKEIEKEFGDVLFALTNYARFLDVNPDNALSITNQKFINRFQYIEKVATEEGKDLNDMSLEEMEAIWVKSKAIYK
jgi:XTP/dITP diphosphohydrolase